MALTAGFEVDLTMKSGTTIVSNELTEWASNGYTLTVPTGQTGPATNVATLNGVNVASFNGVNGGAMLQTTNSAYDRNGANVRHFVIKMPTSDTSPNAIADAANFDDQGLIYFGEIDTISNPDDIVFKDGGDYFVLTQIPSADWFILTVRIANNIDGTTADVWIDDTKVATGLTVNFGGALGLTLGAGADAVWEGNFDLAEFVSYLQVNLTDQQIEDNIAHLQSEWGLSSNPLSGNITLSANPEEGVEVGIWELSTLSFNLSDLGTPEEVVSTDVNGDWEGTHDPTKTYFIAVLHNKLRESGTASGGSLTSLDDSSKAMTVDEHAGRMIEITGGTGSGQMRKIASNTATSFTPDVDFDTAPDNTSTYEVYDMYGAKTKILPATG